MAINITRNENSSTPVEKIVAKQPRDSKGRFVSMPVRCDIPKVEGTNINRPSMKNPINMRQIETNAPFIANFLEDNGLIKEEVDCGHIFHAMCLVAYDDSYYLFFRKNDKFGFHLNCGNLETVLNTEEVNSLLEFFAPFDFDVIQKA